MAICVLRHYRAPLSYDLTTFQFLGQKLSNFFVGILVQTIIPKGHFEINWPLSKGGLQIFVYASNKKLQILFFQGHYPMCHLKRINHIYQLMSTFFWWCFLITFFDLLNYIFKTAAYVSGMISVVVLEEILLLSATL